MAKKKPRKSSSPPESVESETHDTHTVSLSPKKAKGKAKIASKIDWKLVIARAKELVGTNVALAKRLGVSENAVRNWLGGASPPADVLVLLHERIGLDPHFLLTGVGDPASPVAPETAGGQEQLEQALRSIEASVDQLAIAVDHLIPLLSDRQVNDLLGRLRRLLDKRSQSGDTQSGTMDQMQG